MQNQESVVSLQLYTTESSLTKSRAKRSTVYAEQEVEDTGIQTEINVTLVCHALSDREVALNPRTHAGNFELTVVAFTPPEHSEETGAVVLNWDQTSTETAGGWTKELKA